MTRRLSEGERDILRELDGDYWGEEGTGDEHGGVADIWEAIWRDLDAMRENRRRWEDHERESFPAALRTEAMQRELWGPPY